MKKLLFYCTKAIPSLVYFGYSIEEYRCIGKDKESKDLVFHKENLNPNDISDVLNGKIVAECDCDLVEDLSKYAYAYKDEHFYHILEKSCLTPYDLQKYCPIKIYEKNERHLYALYLNNVKAFDKPKPLSDYGLEKAPQNMCYVTDENGEKCVLISIRPEHLVKILNGEKTIEVRRRILNALKELLK